MTDRGAGLLIAPVVRRNVEIGRIAERDTPPRHGRMRIEIGRGIELVLRRLRIVSIVVDEPAIERRLRVRISGDGVVDDGRLHGGGRLRDRRLGG